MHITTAWKYANKGLLAILGISVAATIASVIFLTYTLLSLNSLIERSGTGVSTALVLQDLFINLLEAETGTRGYVLTDDRAFLETYDEAVDRIPANLQTLQNTERLDIDERTVQRIEGLITERMQILDDVIRTYDEMGADAARALIASGEGQDISNDIRAEVVNASSNSLGSIGPTQLESQENLRRSLLVAAIISLFVIATSAAIIWHFQRTIQQERAIEGTKNEFLSLASHQLRTPATAVKQYIGMLLDGYMGDLNEQQRNALLVAYRNNESEIHIMNDLLDVAKLDLQRIQLQKHPSDIVPIVKQVMREYKKAVQARNQTLTLVAPSELVANIDASYMKGVIENLVDNAVKYSKPGTGIKITIGVEAGSFYISVRDHGLGMKHKDISKLFTKFTRLPNEFSANTEGSGLGLYWVKQIMSLHGGTVDVVSKEGKGSIFTVEAPIGS